MKRTEEIYNSSLCLIPSLTAKFHTHQAWYSILNYLLRLSQHITYRYSRWRIELIVILLFCYVHFGILHLAYCKYYSGRFILVPADHLSRSASCDKRMYTKVVLQMRKRSLYTCCFWVFRFSVSYWCLSCVALWRGAYWRMFEFIDVSCASPPHCFLLNQHNSYIDIVVADAFERWELGL